MKYALSIALLLCSSTPPITADQATALSAINRLCTSADAQDRYMGLYLVSKLIDRHEHLDSAQNYTLQAVHDEHDFVKTQGRWLLCKLVDHQLLTEPALQIAEHDLTHQNPLIRMWGLEIYQTLAHNNLHLDQASQALTLCSQDSNIFVTTQRLFLQQILDAAIDHTAEILTIIKTVLQSNDWEQRHFGLYCLSKLVDAKHVLPDLHNILDPVINDDTNEHVKMQALWVLSKSISTQTELLHALTIAQQYIHHTDWHLRFGALIVIDELSKKDFCPAEVHTILQEYATDTHELVKLYLAIR